MNGTPSSPSAKVLVVDDEPEILNLLCSALRMSGFETFGAEGGNAALTAVDAHTPDIVVLDVMLPDIDGFTVARRLRESGCQVPVLFLTARGTVEDRIAGLRTGGDDYVSKPFSLEEVLLRLHAILRRSDPPAPDESHLTYADLELDVDAHRTTRAGKEICLSATEFRLLHYLLLNVGRVVSKEQIVERVWSSGDGHDGRVVETFISQLRRKVDREGAPLIHTIRGFGYTWRLSNNHS